MKYKTCLYYLIVISLFLLLNPVISFFRYSDKVVIEDNVLRLKVKDLEDELKEITNINYSDYDYVLAKITIKNIYNSQVYFLNCHEDFAENLPVINQFGLIGLTKNDRTMIQVNQLKLSVNVNNSNYILDKGIIVGDNLKIHDKVYTSGLTNIPKNILVGEVVEISGDKATIKYVNSNSNYVAILKDYSL